MSMGNMFKKVNAKNIEEYIDSLNSQRKKEILFLDSLIKKTAPSLKPYFAKNMLGYGTFQYINNKTKEILDWQVIGLASQKNYISIYVCATDNKKYIAEMHKSKLGNVKVGKSCINIKKLEDLNIEELKKVIKAAAKHPGLFN